MRSFRASFVQSHRAVIQMESIQRFDGRLGFSSIGHFNKSETPRPFRITVLHDRHGFHRAVSPENLGQLCLGGCGVQVSDKDVNHNFVSESFSKITAELQKQKRRHRRDLASP
jgi:hypothetical protein